MTNVRIQRVNAEIMRVLTLALRDKMGNHHLAGVTVRMVETTSDFSLARVFVQVSGDEAEKSRVMSELDRASGALRNHVAMRVTMKRIPELRFILDRGRDNANRVDELLAQINSIKQD